MPSDLYISPFLLLQAIRDGRLKNRRYLSNLFDRGWLHLRPYTRCKHALDGFEELGLITVDENGDMRLTSKVETLLGAFSLSPSQMASYDHDSLVINPVFGRPPQSPDSHEIFVLMPFKVEFRVLYNNHIKTVAGKYGLSIARADDFFSANAIIDDIWSAINGAKIIIADYTGKNLNVFYETGSAHTLGKPVIPITQTLDDVPFDVAYRRAIVYENTSRGRKKLQDELAKTLEHELAYLARASRVEAANDILSKNQADMLSKNQTDTTT
jgi:hypothetical protein